MPLYKSLAINADTQLHVWKITESPEELTANVCLKDVCQLRVSNMKSEQHRKGFLSVRMLMQHAGYTDFDLYYDSDGKPHLKDGNNISITHSYGFSAIIISSGNVGIDMELRREKVIKIADKFLDREFKYLNRNAANYVNMLIVLWGIKEAVYKMLSENGLSFKDHIYVNEFTMTDPGITATVNFEGRHTSCNCYFEEIEDFTLVYSLGNSKNTPGNE